MKMARFFLLMLIVLVTFGCAPTNEQVKKLVSENVLLTANLEQMTASAKQLRDVNSDLAEELRKQTDISNSFSNDLREKRDESSQTKKTVRSAIKKQFEALTMLMKSESLLDVIGSELIGRKIVSGENLCLVDPNNGITSAGTLVGMWGYFTGPVKLRVILLRPVGEGKYIIVDQSKDFVVEQEGVSKLPFDVPLSADAGDLIGYKFVGEVNVPFDVGTGSMGYFADLTSRQVNIAKLGGKNDKRTYSLRVVGMFGY